MNKIFISSLNKNFKKYEKNLSKTIGVVLADMKKDNFFLEVYLVGDSQMRSLNKICRGQDKTTNVLSFEMPENFPSPEEELKPLGEIYLNPAYISRNLKEFSDEKNLPKFSLAGLAIHGLLHLLGYNHIKKSDRMKMEKKEEFLFSKFLK